MNSKRPSIDRLLALQQLILNFRAVKRVIYIHKNHEAENDVDHSFSLAVTAWYLAQYFPHLNKDTVIRLAMAHDIVEVHAGDTFAYGDQALLDSKAEREAAALKQLESDWPDFSDMTATIHEYEARETEEARFVYALDKIMPAMVIFLTDGYTWKKENITLDMLHNSKKDKVALSPEIAVYYNELHKLLLAHPQLFSSRNT